MSSYSGVRFSSSSLGHEFGNILGKADNGVHMSFTEGNRHSPLTKVVFSGEHPMTSTIKESLESYSDHDGGVDKLFPFQINAITNMVYRPPAIEVTKVIKKPRVSPDGILYHCTHKGVGTVSLRARDEDIGMTVVNDLFTGSGKTLTSVLGALIFARDRRESVIERYPLLVREQTHHSWNTRVSRYSVNPMCTEPRYSNTVIIMCSKHLINQWVKACRQSASMMGLYVDIMVNHRIHPDVNAESKKGGGTMNVTIFDNSISLKQSGIKFVPTIIVDEFVSKNVSNILTRSTEDMPIHGRLILVSADAGSVRNVLFGAKRNSFLRRMIGYDDSDVGMEVENTMRHAIPMMSSCVLPTEERERARDFMFHKMSDIPYEEYIIRYTPSLSSRLFGANSEMSAVSGRQIFLDRFGIEMKDVKSIGDIIRVIKETLGTLEQSDSRIRPLRDLQVKLESFDGENESCPICLENYNTVSKASVLNPCWHMFCTECVSKLLSTCGTRCPMCRTDIEGHTVALSTHKESNIVDVEKKDPEESLPTSSSLLENIKRSMRSSMGLEGSCIKVVECLGVDFRLHGGKRQKCYRVIMVVPDDYFFGKFSDRIDREFEEGMVEIIRFQTSGGKRSRVTHGSISRSIERFGSDDGARMKILFTTEGRTDSLTGLDFPDVDCLISVGLGNTMQRLGRLTRSSRFMREEYRGMAVRSISLVPK